MKPSVVGLSCLIGLVLSVFVSVSPVLAQPAISESDASLLAAADKGDVQAVAAALKLGADANAVNAEGYTALELAAMRGRLYDSVPSRNMADQRLEIVKLLLNKGARIARVDTEPTHPVYTSWRILADALYFRHYEIVKPLLQAGANPQALSLATILHAYPAKGKVFRLQRMFFEKALATSESTLREWALGDAVTTSDDSEYFVRRLLDSGVDPNAHRWDGFTALTLAVQSKNTDVVKLLLKRKADANAPIIAPQSAYIMIGTRMAGKTPLRLAEEKKDTRMIALLKSAGAHE